MWGSVAPVWSSVPHCDADAGGPVRFHRLDVYTGGGMGVFQLGMYTQLCL